MKPYLLAQADATRLPLADKSVDLVLGSPPYCDARTYGIDAQRGCLEWVEWMLAVTTEAVRVSRGLVLWVAAGVTRDKVYWPACEGLMWEWWKLGGEHHLWRPAYWHRHGIPGSGGKQWLRADVEYVMAFKAPGNLPWSDNTALGHKPKWGPGGEMSNRLSSGKRINQWGPIGSKNGFGKRFKRGDETGGEASRPSHVVATAEEWTRRHTKSRADGTDVVQSYTPPVKANPGNLIKTKVGGGHLGHSLAHDNEAPFPMALAEFFIRSFCPPGGIVLDPFSGSGTTVDTARHHGRRGLGFDLRLSQCQLGLRRLRHPHAKKSRKKREAKELCLFDERGAA